MKRLPVSLIGAAFAFVGCTSQLQERLQKSDGLIDCLVAGNRADLPNPVKKVSGRSGSVVTSHLRGYGDRIYVFGLVSRASIVEPGPGAHVDIKVENSRGQLVQTAAVAFIPRTIPHSLRGTQGRSSYAATLAIRPAPDATVAAVFHDIPISRCELSDNTPR
jgi:hypothetical protein